MGGDMMTLANILLGMAIAALCVVALFSLDWENTPTKPSKRKHRKVEKSTLPITSRALCPAFL
jgi:hypothetical protein